MLARMISAIAIPGRPCFRLAVAPAKQPAPSRRPQVPRDSRVREVVVGSLVILALGAGICLLWLARSMPGFLGESFGMLAGIASTPFLMEASLIALGLVAVLAVNHFRQRREGDELVYLERAEGPDAEDLPDSARWAIYRDPPLPPPPDLTLDEIEGAIAIGDHQAASEAIAALDPAQQSSAEVLTLRIRLARASGRDQLARDLEARLAESGGSAGDD